MIKAEEIINKQFSRAFWGYDIGEVDTFLDEIVRANERAEQELEIAQLRIRMLLEELEHYTGKREDAKEATGQKAEAPASKPVETGEKKENAEEKNTMSETVTIRYVAPEDLDAVTMVEATCFPEAEAATRDRIEARIQTFPKNFWVAEVDGRVIGFINGMA